MAQINNMIEKLTQAGGPVMPNKFSVRLFWNGGYFSNSGNAGALSQFNEFFGGSALLLASAINIPSRSVVGQTYRPFSVGKEMAHTAMYQGDIAISFIETENTPIRSIFEYWMDQIVNTKTGTINYYDGYVGDIAVTLEKADGTPVYDILIREAYPKVLDSVPLSYGAAGHVLQNVTFSFKQYEYISSTYTSPWTTWPGSGPVVGAGDVSGNPALT